MAYTMGAAPRYLGSNDACTLIAPSGGIGVEDLENLSALNGGAPVAETGNVTDVPSGTTRTP